MSIIKTDGWIVQNNLIAHSSNPYSLTLKIPYTDSNYFVNICGSISNNGIGYLSYYIRQTAKTNDTTHSKLEICIASESGMGDKFAYIETKGY